MSKRNDMITRMVNVYKLRLRFFDTESRQQQETFTERYSRRDEMDMIRDEFARWKNVKPYVLTGVDVLSKERVLILAQMSYLISEIEKITKEIENEQEKRHDNQNGERV